MMRRRSISLAEFYQEARDRYQLEFDSDKEGAGDRPLSLADIEAMDIKPTAFLMANMFRAGELIILSGAAKTSKSHVVMDIAIALACKGGISDRIYANSACKVALVDAELSLEALMGRFRRIGALHGNNEKWSKSFFVISAIHEKRPFDLSDEADQKWLEKKIGDAKIVIFDNYGKLTRPNGDGFQTWRQVAAWFERLQQRGVTVILIQHENKSEKVRGTMKMIDDADLHVALKRPQDWKPSDGNIVEMHFPAARHLHGDQLEPFSITYAEDTTGFHRYVGSVGESKLSPAWVKAPVVSEMEIGKHGLSSLHVEMLTIARKKGAVRAGDVVEQAGSGRGRTSVTNAFSDLCAKNLLTPQGESKKGRHYVPFSGNAGEEPASMSWEKS